MKRHDHSKLSSISHFLPWIIAGAELIIISLLAIQIVHPYEEYLGRNGGFTYIPYKFQDPNDTEGSNCYIVVPGFGGIPYTVEVSSDQYRKIICDEDVVYSMQIAIYQVGHVKQAKLVNLDVDSPADNRPDSEKNGPTPDG